jgi:hypothetical protein
MRNPPDMPELEKNAAPRNVHGPRHPPPALDLLGRVDARRRNIALPLRQDLRRLGDDQTCACPLGIIQCVELGGDIAYCCPASGERRHDGAVLAFVGTDDDGREEVGAHDYPALPLVEDRSRKESRGGGAPP